MKNTFALRGALRAPTAKQSMSEQTTPAGLEPAIPLKCFASILQRMVGKSMPYPLDHRVFCRVCNEQQQHCAGCSFFLVFWCPFPVFAKDQPALCKPATLAGLEPAAPPILQALPRGRARNDLLLISKRYAPSIGPQGISTEKNEAGCLHAIRYAPKA